MAAIVFDDRVGVDIVQGLHGPATLSRRLGRPEDVIDGLADHRGKGHDERHRESGFSSETGRMQVIKIVRAMDEFEKIKWV